jgi:hypothetical protein
MALTDRTVLEIDGNYGPYAGETGVFVIREDLEDVEETSFQHIAGNRGQYIAEIYDQVTDLSELVDGADQRDRRAGYHLDGGAGEDSWTITGKTGVDDPDEQWGTGETDPTDPADITQLDATGCSPVSKRDIIGRWAAQQRIDSSTPARLYRGEWSDGTHADSPGVFGRPIPVVIKENRLTKSPDDPSVAEVSFTLIRTSDIPDIVEDAADDIVDALGDIVPDY